MHCLYISLLVCVAGVLPVIFGVPRYHDWDRGLVKHRNIRSVSGDRQTMGVAEIFYKDDIICSGTHLKPWIILTTAECVEKHGKNETYAVVIIEKDKKIVNLKVEVSDIKIDPKYKGGSQENNRAILILYGQNTWDVNEFQLPEHDYTPDKIANSKLATYVTEWNPKGLFNYESVTESVSVTLDYKLCGDVATASSTTWYCVLDNKGKHNYTEVDIGSPFFFNADNNRYCLGLYTGLHLRDNMKGSLYQSIYPSIDWIRQVVHETPVPPE